MCTAIVLLIKVSLVHTTQEEFVKGGALSIPPFAFPKFRVANGREFFGKEDDTEVSYPEFPFHLALLPEFSVEWFAFRKLNNFKLFWKLSQEISLQFVPVSKFSGIFVEWKAPGGFTLKTHQMFSVHSTPEEFNNTTVTGRFEFAFKENSVREIT